MAQLAGIDALFGFNLKIKPEKDTPWMELIGHGKLVGFGRQGLNSKTRAHVVVLKVSRLTNHSPNSMTRSCTRARCVWKLAHQTLYSFTIFPSLGTFRKQQPAACLKPAIKPL